MTCDMQKKRYLLSVLIAVIALFILIHFLRVSSLPKASEAYEPLYMGSVSYENVIESFEHPSFTKSNHMLKLRVTDTQKKAYRYNEPLEGITFTEDGEYTAKILACTVLENHAESQFAEGDTVRLLSLSDSKDWCAYLPKGSVFWFFPEASRSGSDVTEKIGGETYYYMTADVFFIVDGFVYPYSDMDIEDKYPNITEFARDAFGKQVSGNPYNRYRAMPEWLFVNAMQNVIKNPK